MSEDFVNLEDDSGTLQEADLEEIVTETKIFNDMIEDTDQFISAHLDSVRNEIIKLSLFIEVGALIMASGAVVSGIFGMNLLNKIEEHEYGSGVNKLLYNLNDSQSNIKDPAIFCSQKL